jgi:hypothetical protein
MPVWVVECVCVYDEHKCVQRQGSGCGDHVRVRDDEVGSEPLGEGR